MIGPKPIALPLGYTPTLINDLKLYIIKYRKSILYIFNNDKTGYQKKAYNSI